MSSHPKSFCNLTAAIAAFDRIDATLRTLATIVRCNPRPEEIIVHADGGNPLLIRAIREQFPEVIILASESLLGPGGSRNLLATAATHPWIASFDDDAAPETSDYFSRILDLTSRYPEVAVFSAASQPSDWLSPDLKRIGVFSGCGCVFSKKWFFRTRGFVPLPVAYGMEEVDLSLQLHDSGGTIVHVPDLRVFHDRQPFLPDAHIHAAIIVNCALLPFLRYPILLWPLGLWHIVSRITVSIRNHWWAGLITGVFSIPQVLARKLHYRHPVKAQNVVSWLHLRRHPRLFPSSQIE